MLILFDNNVPRGLALALTGHVVVEARARGWALLKNGELLSVDEEAGFEVLLTTDKNIRYQQNLAGRRIALVVLSRQRWGSVNKAFREVADAVNASSEGSFVEVEIPR